MPPPAPAILDTDILSEILKQKNPTVAQRAAAYLGAHSAFAFSALTRYEILRGLLAKQATAQLQRFQVFCQQSLVFAISDSLLDRAAHLWAMAQQQGHPCSDADLIIAATALEHSRVLVTGNAAHFTWITGLMLEDWRVP
jgi:tRNA(fMet)-specific endonuclease VapC